MKILASSFFKKQKKKVFTELWRLRFFITYQYLTQTLAQTLVLTLALALALTLTRTQAEMIDQEYAKRSEFGDMIAKMQAQQDAQASS